jgi:hypothetical protein
VPPNYQAPQTLTRHGLEYQPKYNKTLAEEQAQWDKDNEAWNNGTHETLVDDPELKIKYPKYEDWTGKRPDDPKYYVDYDPDLCTWWQLYESVSEGTPVSPPFATKEELASYLSTYGDFWEQARAKREHRQLNLLSYEQAMKVVEGGWLPSMAVKNGQVLMDGDLVNEVLG